MAKATAYYILLGQTKYAWNSTKDYSLKLGGAKKASGVTGLSFGINSPKPPRVKASLENGKIIQFFVDPATKLSDISGKTIAGSKVKTVSYA